MASWHTVLAWLTLLLLIKISGGYIRAQRGCLFGQRNRMFRTNLAAAELEDLPLGSPQPVDYTALRPDDPFFLDMPWPVEPGPESAAFARHMQWRRQLSDNERLRWQRWAVYQRSNAAEQFDFGLQDFIAQGLRSCLKEGGIGGAVNASTYTALALQLQAAEETEVRAVMKAYYAAFNRLNFDDIQLLWLPSKDCGLVLPGFQKARGDREVEALYRRVAAVSKPMGKVSANITQVNCRGNIALVHTVEEVGPGTAAQLYTRPSRRSGAVPAPAKVASAAVPRVLATTVLRRANKQWRILSHHAERVHENPFADEAVGVTFTSKDAARRKYMLQRLQHGTQLKPKGGDQAEHAASHRLPPDVSALLQQQLERIFRDTHRAVADPAPSRSELQRRPDSSLQRIITLMSPVGADHSPAGQAQESALNKPKEGSPALNILSVDFTAPASQQTVQAIRALRSQGRLNAEEQQALLADVVDCAASGAVSRAQAACQLLYAAPLRSGSGAASGRGPADEEYAEDLALQLRSIASDLRGSE